MVHPSINLSVRVLAVSLPGARAESPSLACGLLQALCDQENLSCETLYGPLVAHYILAQAGHPSSLLSGPQAEQAFGVLCFSGKTLVPATGLPTESLSLGTAVLEHILQLIPWAQYDAVWLQADEYQLMTALALAPLVKQAAPQITLILSGGACAGSAGEQFLRYFPDIDIAVSAPITRGTIGILRQLPQRLSQSKGVPMVGVAWRDTDGNIQQELGHAVRDSASEEMPLPNYQSYFDQMTALNITDLVPVLPISSADREQILQLSSRYRVTRFRVHDQTLSLDALTGLAQVQEPETVFTLSYNPPVALTNAEVQALGAAGTTRVSLDILSLSDRALGRLHRSQMGIEYVQSLRLLAEARIHADWRLAYHIPGEDTQDYMEALDLMARITHLPPPSGISPLEVQRQAPYCDNQSDSLHPTPPYDLMVAVGLDVSTLCQRFVSLPTAVDPELARIHNALLTAVDAWQIHFQPDLLTYTVGPGFVRIVDRIPRTSEVQETIITLHGLQAEIFLACREVQELATVVAQFSDRSAEGNITNFVRTLAARGLVYLSPSNHCLVLPVHVNLNRLWKE